MQEFTQLHCLQSVCRMVQLKPHMSYRLPMPALKVGRCSTFCLVGSHNRNYYQFVNPSEIHTAFLLAPAYGEEKMNCNFFHSVPNNKYLVVSTYNIEEESHGKAISPVRWTLFLLILSSVLFCGWWVGSGQPLNTHPASPLLPLRWGEGDN